MRQRTHIPSVEASCPSFEIVARCFTLRCQRPIIDPVVGVNAESC